jgi:hypothetical protein
MHRFQRAILVVWLALAAWVALLGLAAPSRAHHAVPLPDFGRVTFHMQVPCPGEPDGEVTNCAMNNGNGTADVWMAPGFTRHEYMHELGHVFDYQRGETANFRFRFAALLRDRRAWRSDGGNSLHEQFAEAYAFCATGVHPADAGSYGYGYNPSRRVHRLICRAIRGAAKPEP